jgi:uncharacterized protein
VTVTQLIVVGSAVFVAAFIQIIAGFGFALLSVPLMTLAIEPKTAVVVSTLTGIVVTTWQAYRLRADIDRVLAKKLLIGAYAGMPVGFLAFVLATEDTLRLCLGVSVVIAVILLVMRIDLSRASARLDYGLGFVSGMLNTSLSTNGPPLVFDLQVRQLAAAPFRATISAVFAVSNIMALTLFVVFGKVTADGLRASAITIPAMVIGQLLGYPIRKHVHGERFRWLVIVLLVAAATSSIVNALR